MAATATNNPAAEWVRAFASAQGLTCKEVKMPLMSTELVDAAHVMNLYRRIKIAGKCSEAAPQYVFYSTNAQAVSVIATIISTLGVTYAGPLDATRLVPGVKASVATSTAPLAVFLRGLLSAERNCSFAEFKKVLERHLSGDEHTCVVCWESILETNASACPRCHKWVCESCRSQMERPDECPHCRGVSQPEVFCCEECAQRHYEGMA
jgi:hypothetical protein